jgi:hypothetical protein
MPYSAFLGLPVALSTATDRLVPTLLGFGKKVLPVLRDAWERGTAFISLQK